MADEEHTPTEQPSEERQAQDRIILPLVIPAIAFLFALLVIYGLSRIYLELDTYEIGDVSMATPLAIGVALVILGACAWLASARRITFAQIGMVGVVAVALLTGGAIWAAVHDEGETHAGVENGGEPTPSDGTAEPPGEGIAVGLIDPEWAVTVSPDSTAAGEITFSVTNDGTIIHNMRIVQADDPEALPLDDSGFVVDESVVDVLVETSGDLSAGEAEEVTGSLEAGSYVIFCNIAQHYTNGMYTAFTVE